MEDAITHADLNIWEGSCELSAGEIIRRLKRIYARPSSKEHVNAKAA